MDERWGSRQDQGSQFTSTDFAKVLQTGESAINIDSKGAWRDNVLVVRLLREAA